MKRWVQVLVVIALVFAAAQLIRPDRTNPPVDASRTLAAHYGAASPLVAVLGRACDDCHSDATAWSRYPTVAPLSWVIASAVAEGRQAVNFSNWAAYAPERQRALLVQSCRTASNSQMPPGVFVMLRPGARLSAQDVRVICSAAGVG